MKRILIFLTTFIALSSTVYSQDFKFGLRLGPNFCQIDGDESNGYNKTGYHVGIYTAYPFTENSSAIMELMYTTKGARNTNIMRVTVLDYIEVSLLYGLHFSRKIQAVIGFSPSVLINYSVTESGVDIDDLISYKRFDLPFSVGLRFFFNPHIGLDLRFNYSLLNISGDSNIGTSGLFGAKGQFNNVISGSLIYQF